MKRRINNFTRVLLVTGALFFCSFTALKAEDLTITTYYPSPFGSYNEVSANTVRFNTTAAVPNCISGPGAVPAGSVRFNAGDQRLDICANDPLPDGPGWKRITAAPVAAGFWAASTLADTNDIRNTNTSGVIIGHSAATANAPNNGLLVLGNVGIGGLDGSTAWRNPTAALDVWGSVRLRLAGASAGSVLTSTDNNGNASWSAPPVACNWNGWRCRCAHDDGGTEGTITIGLFCSGNGQITNFNIMGFKISGSTSSCPWDPTKACGSWF